MLIKIICIFFIIAVSETANGFFRVKFLNKKFGHKKSKIISFFSGSSIIAFVLWNTISWMAPENINQSLLIGIILAFLMISYDLIIGRFVFKFSWQMILKDFDFRKGNLLSFGMIFIFVFPTILFLIR